jgi:hypothetical protein
MLKLKNGANKRHTEKVAVQTGDAMADMVSIRIMGAFLGHGDEQN